MFRVVVFLILSLPRLSLAAGDTLPHPCFESDPNLAPEASVVACTNF
ncbi:MAG: hypothetical protein ACRBB0_05990 [Pelagimonas sp.]